MDWQENLIKVTKGRKIMVEIHFWRLFWWKLQNNFTWPVAYRFRSFASCNRRNTILCKRENVQGSRLILSLALSTRATSLYAKEDSPASQREGLLLILIPCFSSLPRYFGSPQTTRRASQFFVYKLFSLFIFNNLMFSNISNASINEKKFHYNF